MEVRLLVFTALKAYSAGGRRRGLGEGGRAKNCGARRSAALERAKGALPWALAGETSRTNLVQSALGAEHRDHAVIPALARHGGCQILLFASCASAHPLLIHR